MTQAKTVVREADFYGYGYVALVVEEGTCATSYVLAGTLRGSLRQVPATARLISIPHKKNTAGARQVDPQTKQPYQEACT